MNKLVIYLLLVTLISCGIRKSQVVDYVIHIDYDNLYSIQDNHNYLGKDTIILRHDTNGEILEEGGYAVDNNGNLSDLKVGLWIEYYPGGLIKSKGLYDISSYIQCCFGGYCKQFVNYRKGSWVFNYPNGKLMASGSFDNHKKHIETSCEGGDSLVFHSIAKNKWRFYDYKGNLVQMPDSVRNKLETIHIPSDNGYDLLYLKPTNREEVIFDW